MMSDTTNKEPKTQSPPTVTNAVPTDKSANSSTSVVVRDSWLFVDGCKVARVEPGGVIAFKDKCRRRSSSRGSDQVRVSVHDLAQAIEARETMTKRAD